MEDLNSNIINLKNLPLVKYLILEEEGYLTKGSIKQFDEDIEAKDNEEIKSHYLKEIQMQLDKVYRKARSTEVSVSIKARLDRITSTAGPRGILANITGRKKRFEKRKANLIETEIERMGKLKDLYPDL